MIERDLYGSEHEAFRDAVRRFMEQEVAPHRERWEAQGHIDRDTWLKAGDAGFLCPTMPECYGGAGVDRLFSAVLIEELARIGASGPGFGLHSEIVAPYILHYGTEEARRRYLPRMASGEMIGAIAMTEPSTGSDLQAVRTTAVRDGDVYVVNGSKTFITNGGLADLAVVVAKTDPSKGAKGVSLLIVDTSMPGFTKGRTLAKLGMKAQDTAELFFDNVRVPAANLLGEENAGFPLLMAELPWERLQIAIMAVSAAEAALAWTVAYVRERHVFGAPVLSFQTTRHTLAELKTEVQIARVFVDKCTALMIAGLLDTETASMAKYWTTDLQCKVVDACLQLHGGYGYMWEYPIARAFADARVQRIYGGTNEVMKELIARGL